MTFVQSMEFATERREELFDLTGRWSADAIDIGTSQRVTMAEDRSAPGRFLTLESVDAVVALDVPDLRRETSPPLFDRGVGRDVEQPSVEPVEQLRAVLCGE